MAKKLFKIILIVFVFVGLIALLSSLVITKENEYSVVKRFNKIDRVYQEAGLSFKVPFLESVDKLPKQIQFYDMSESDVITQDKKAMVADSYVLWKIVKPIVFAQTLNSSTTLAQSRIDSNVYNAMKTVISSMEQNEVISGRDGELSIAFLQNMDSSMEQYGIEMIAIETKRLDLPSDNKAAVFDRMISERAQMAANFTAEGESEAQMIQNLTDKEIAISISNAETQAAKIIAEGESEYMRVLSDAYSDESRSEFYTFVRSLEAAKASLSGADKTLIMSADSPLAQIFYNID
ncbi:MAG TPA: protease modulator HflC [Mobilitalea sp.]|nr:protease modulator HflC [Mobilitalea sp.]